MGRAVDVPVTPSVLLWAIEESGYDADQIAHAAGVSTAILKQWVPAYNALESCGSRTIAETNKATPPVGSAVCDWIQAGPARGFIRLSEAILDGEFRSARGQNARPCWLRLLHQDFHISRFISGES